MLTTKHTHRSLSAQRFSERTVYINNENASEFQGELMGV
jgi:hypothetical protein